MYPSTVVEAHLPVRIAVLIQGTAIQRSASDTTITFVIMANFVIIGLSQNLKWWTIEVMTKPGTLCGITADC